MKKLALCMSALALFLTLSGFASGKMFGEVNSYKSGTFTDVKSTDWFESEVASAYSIGLMNGVSETSFSPNGNVTVAQAVTLASRINAVYNGKTINVTTTGVWYKPYTDYAVSNGLIKSDAFDSFDRAITRLEMVSLFADALPSEYYSALNSISAVPDVDSNNPSYTKLLSMYNAGIVLGNDDYGTFRPDSSIKRCEAAAIVNRVANPENRLKGKLLTVTRNTALVLVEDNEMSIHGWMKDTRGMSYYTRLSSTNDAATLNSFSDTSTKYPSYKIRNFREQTTGVLTYVLNFTLNDDSEGFLVSINDRKGNDVFVTRTSGGKFFVGDKAVYTYSSNGVTTLKAVIDLDSGKFEIYFNSTYCGSFPTTGKVASRINVGFDEVGTGFVNIGGGNLSVNYYLIDHFLGHTDGADWSFVSNGNAQAETVRLSNSNFSNEDVFSYRIENPSGKTSTASKTFRPASGNTGFEYKFLLPKAQSGVTFRLGTMENGFYVTTNGTNLCAPDGSVIGTYSPNVWTTVRAEVNTTTGKAFVRINGKDKGEFATAGKPYAFTEFAAVMNTNSDTELIFDDVIVYPVMPEPDDYVPEPVPVKSDDSYLGMNTCDLWRFGYWRGSTSSWMVCSAYDELTPYMGYYDDGIPEVSDWEIKWMSEHGIDYQLQCWYGPTTGNAPVKTPGFYNNLHEGYFNSKYKNYSKFAIMWENNFTDNIDSDGFRNYFVPYWIEYYFKDPNYMVIDNKPVFSVYSFSEFLRYFGSVEGAKAEVDYLRSEVQKLGFDDIILLFAGGSGDANAYKNMAAVGAEGAYNYNLGKPSSSDTYQMSVMTSNAARASSVDGIVYVPTISMGFNNVARGDTRSDNINITDYRSICSWTKNTLMTNPAYYDQSSYMSKMYLLSCWNEYDEGHYLNPSNLHGFEYLDVLRDVFATGDVPSHTDNKPTENQVSRLQVLFPDNYSMLRPLRWYNYATTQSDAELSGELENNDRLKVWDFTQEGFYQTSGWRLGNATLVSSDGKVVYKANNGDPIFQIGGLNLDIADADYVHVRVKGIPDSGAVNTTLQVFFTTFDSPSWTSDKCVNARYDTGKTVDLYINMKANKIWKGTLTALRLDVLGELGTMEVEFVEIIKSSIDAAKMNVTIDGRKAEFEFPIDNTAGIIVPFVPSSGIFGMLDASYKWSRFTGILDMTVGKTNMVFTVGSDKVVVNGVEKTLGKEMYLVDGIPMLPLDKICEFAGYIFETEDGVTINITTPDGDEAQKINDYEKNKIPYSYLFDIDGNFENWRITSGFVSSSAVIDGSVYMKSTGNDPNMSLSGISIDSSKYKKCIVRMKSKIAANNGITIYFAAGNQSLDEKKTVRVSVLAASTDFVEYELDMSSNELWTGAITQIRFDPLSCEGECWIDYIKFVE